MKLLVNCVIFLVRIKAKSDQTNVKFSLAMFVIVRHFASIVRKINRNIESEPYILRNLPQNTQYKYIFPKKIYFFDMNHLISICIGFILDPILC